MDLDYLERLLDLVGRAPIAELELSHEGWRLRLVKAESAPGDAEVRPMRAERAEGALSGSPDGDAATAHVVAAGLVGTFYRGPAPGKPPFVAIGDIVAEGQTLGILEAMKTLLQVEADQAGQIEAIFQDDGTPVQAGTPLFRIVAAHP